MNSSNPLRKIRRLGRSTRGANMVEYIILVGIVALLCIVGFNMFGGAVNGKIQEQSGTVGNIKTPAAP